MVKYGGGGGKWRGLVVKGGSIGGVVVVTMLKPFEIVVAVVRVWTGVVV